MKKNRKSVVAIVKVKDNAIDEAVKEMFDLLGGIESFILPFKNVLLKTNWVKRNPYEKGAVTNPQLK